MAQANDDGRKQVEVGMTPGDGNVLAMRPATGDDEPFLFALYCSTRAAEMALVDWSAEQKQRFLQMQFQAQQEHYHANFPQAEHQIILLQDAPVGRIYVDRAGDEIRLLDITISPEQRNNGLGSRLMTGLQAEGAASGRPVRFYVWQLNHDAQRFYKRLGFYETGEAGAYMAMEWQPT